MSSSLTSTSGNRLPRARSDRRAALSALALLLVVVGALGSALVVYRTGQRVDVLVAARRIEAGQKVTSADFGIARVSAGADSTLKSADKKNFVGTFATTAIPSGTLLNRLMFQVGNVVPNGGVIVGVAVTSSQRPAANIQSGDVVRAYLVPKTSSNSATATPGPILLSAARVAQVSSSSTSGDSETVSLLVSAADAQTLVTAAGQGAVTLAELPKSTKPTIDFRTSSS